MKRALAVLLILVLLLALFTVDALAGDPGEFGEKPPVDSEDGSETQGDDDPSEEGEAQIEGDEAEQDNGSEDLSASVFPDDGVLTSGTYMLTENVTVDALTLNDDYSAVLDLNGKTLNCNCPNNWGIYVGGGATLTIQDSVGGGTIVCAKYGINNGYSGSGTLIFLSGTISGESSVVANRAGSSAQLLGGTFITSAGQTIQNQGVISVSGRDTLIDATDGYGLWNIQGASATLSEGVTVRSTYYGVGNGLSSNDGSVCNISDCDIFGASGALENLEGCSVQASNTQFSSTSIVIENDGEFSADANCSIRKTNGGLGFISGKGSKENVLCDFVDDTEWIVYVLEQYPEGIPSSEYEIDTTNRVIKIYSADGLAWWASRLDVKAGINENLQNYQIILQNDIDLSKRPWRFSLQSDKFKNGVFDGNGKTVSGLFVIASHNNSGTAGYGFVGDTGGNSGPLTIKNVSFKDADVPGVTGAGVVFGYLSCQGTLENVHVVDSYVYGHMIGGLIGSIDDRANIVLLNSCTVSNTTIETSGWNGGGLVGRYQSAGKLTIQNCEVSDISIRAKVHAGGFIGLAEMNSEVILDSASTVNNVQLPRRAEYQEVHTVSVGGIDNQNNVRGRNDYILDGLFDGGYYSNCAAVSYSEFYIKSHSTKWDAETYSGYTDGSFFSYDLPVRNHIVGNNEESVERNNYDYSTHTVKPSVIYYAVYNDGLNQRSVLYGYEYVSTGNAVSGKTLYGDLDCTAVTWYTDEACTQTYDMSTPVTESITLYTPLELWDGVGKLDLQRLTAVQDALPQLDGLTVTWAARQKGSLDIPTTAVAEIPDMTLKIYTGFIVTFDPNGGNLNCPETVFVPAKAILESPTDPTREGYVFDGWYTAKDGGERWNFETPITKSMTLYAHWGTHASLTITKSNTLLENQSFVYRVTGENIDLVVTLHGNGSVTIDMLPLGEYTVQEISAWSWRYAPAEQKSVSLVKGNATVSFDNGTQETAWLSGENYGG